MFPMLVLKIQGKKKKEFNSFQFNLIFFFSSFVSNAMNNNNTMNVDSVANTLSLHPANNDVLVDGVRVNLLEKLRFFFAG